MHQGECGVIIALYILAGCVGLLIGFALLFAFRLHIAEDSVQFNTRSLVALNDSLIKSIKLTDQHLEAHRRFMRNAVKDASGLGADFMRRLDDHEQRLRIHTEAVNDLARMVAKLDRAGHRHPDMTTPAARAPCSHSGCETKGLHVHVDRRDMPENPEQSR
jgi:hypothetical protein